MKYMHPIEWAGFCGQSAPNPYRLWSAPPDDHEAAMRRLIASLPTRPIPLTPMVERAGLLMTQWQADLWDRYAAGEFR